MRARLNPILKYGGASNEKSKALFPLPHPHPSISLSLRLSSSDRFFSPSPWLCRRGQEERQKESVKRETERKKRAREGRRENGERGRVIEMRDLGAGGAKQRQTALVGGVNQ